MTTTATDVKTDDELYYDEMSRLHPQWQRRPPAQDDRLTQRWGPDAALILGAQNIGGGGGGGFDPKASDSRIVGKLVHREAAGDSTLDSAFKLVGKRLIGVKGEESPMTRIMDVDRALTRLRSFDVEVLWHAYGPTIHPVEVRRRLGDWCAVVMLTGEAHAGFATYRDAVLSKATDDERQHHTDATRSRLTSAEQFFASSKPDQAEDTARTRWLLTKATDVVVARAKLESVRLVHHAWNSWRDVVGRKRPVERYTSEQEMLVARDAREAELLKCR